MKLIEFQPGDKVQLVVEYDPTHPHWTENDDAIVSYVKVNENKVGVVKRLEADGHSYCVEFDGEEFWYSAKQMKLEI